MQQQCQQCGNVSDRPTRFCRQCGAQLFVENEATSATTRQYAPQQSANPYDAPYQSQLAQAQSGQAQSGQAQSGQDRRFDNQTPDTSRLYHTPMGQNYPNYPANYQQAEAKKSGAWKWVLITLLCVVLVTCGIGAMVISAIRAKHAVAPIIPSSEDIEAQVRDQIQREIERTRQETAHATEEARKAAQEAGAPIPPLPPLPPSVPGELPAGIQRYKYPNAEVRGSGGVFGNNVATMITSDNVSKVRDYYKKQLGAPMLETEDDETVIFQIQGSPMILITISEDKEDPDKTQITVLRTNLQLPKLN